VSRRQLLVDLVLTLPETITDPAWRRFVTTLDVVGRYLYGMPAQAERDDDAWQHLLAEQHDDVDRSHRAPRERARSPAVVDYGAQRDGNSGRRSG
jgi:hypothetical protein